MNNYAARCLTGILTLLIAAATGTAAQEGVQDGNWPSYGGDKGSTKYSNLDQIDRDNFAELETAWTWRSIDVEVQKLPGVRVRPQEFKSTPLMANGVLYTSTSFSQVAAIDAGTGETLWTHDPGSWREGRPANIGFIHRGVSYWTDGAEERVFVTTGHGKLIALNAKTGARIEGFGDGGVVDLSVGLNRQAPISAHTVNSPPVICRDLLVVGSVIMDRPPTKEYVRGDVRAFDVRTGAQRWQFHSIPQEGEFGNETWEDGSWAYTGNTNVWSLISADEELGYVYLPFGAPTNDFYGGHRPGDNLFANSLVCLNVETGERVWHFQTVHHDLWDYDLPCAPNLVNAVIDGKPVKAVAQFSKNGYCYVFDRVTGEPIWPIVETPVPQSTVPGEKTSPTQPIPTKPPPFAALGLTEENLIDFTPEIEREARRIVSEYGFSPVFTPPTEKGVFMTPGDGGGANWPGAALDPATSILYVSSMSHTMIVKVIKPDPNRSNMDYVVSLDRIRGPFELPLLKEPASRITAVDLKTGTHAWMTPMGDGPRDHPKLRDLDLPPLGSGMWSFPLTTKTLLIVAHEGELLAMDKATGTVLAKQEVRGVDGRSLGWITGAPMTYMHEGKQYIVSATTSLDGAYLMAYALP